MKIRIKQQPKPSYTKQVAASWLSKNKLGSADPASRAPRRDKSHQRKWRLAHDSSIGTVIATLSSVQTTPHILPAVQVFVTVWVAFFKDRILKP